MRSGILMAVLIGTLVASSAGTAWAEEGEVAKAEKEIHKEAKEAGKVNLFKGLLDLSVYTIIVFLILFAILWRFAWKPIATGLDAREQSIARDRNEADHAKKEAGAMRDKLAAERAKADAEIRGMMDKARADAQQTAAEELARGKADLAAERERGYREVAMARDAMQKEVYDNGVMLATLISAKTIKKQLTEHDHRALIDEALSDFRAAAQARKSDLEAATA
jgi:F-type H+-transporting ATPase subunit b